MSRVKGTVSRDGDAVDDETERRQMCKYSNIKLIFISELLENFKNKLKCEFLWIKWIVSYYKYTGVMKIR